MQEWLDVMQKSARTAQQPGTSADEVRRAETECGVPFPADLAELYRSMDGGDFLGDVTLFPLRGGGGQPSVLEKSRLMMVGLPAAGVWRFGLKGPHRHLFAARKAAMEEQGDGGGPLPEWVDTLDAEDWLYGTWDFEERQMRLYRSLPAMLAVLVPPAEEHGSFGDKTFARALSAVEGALHALGVDPERLKHALDAKAAEQLKVERLLPDEAQAPATRPQRKAASRKAAKKTPARKAPAKAAVKRAPAKAAKKAAAKGAPAKKAAAKGAPAKKAAAKGAAKKAPARKVAAKKAPARKAAAKRAPARKDAAKKAPAQKRGSASRGGRR